MQGSVPDIGQNQAAQSHQAILCPFPNDPGFGMLQKVVERKVSSVNCIHQAFQILMLDLTQVFNAKLFGLLVNQGKV